MQNEWFYFNSQKESFKEPFGASVCGENVKITVWANARVNISDLKMHFWQEGKEKQELFLEYNESKEGFTLYNVTFKLPKEPGLIWYYFSFQKEGKWFYYGNNEKALGGIGKIYYENPVPYQITVFKIGFKTPAWLKNAVIYQIFPDRYYNGNENGKINNPKENSLLHAHWQDTPVYTHDIATGKILAYDFFGGNLSGIIKKLPYLKKMGINIIYLNPIFEAESNHRYDTGNYKKIDEMLGDEVVFEQLCSEAEELGIKIILDGVFSHTGSNSLYFNKKGIYSTLGAYQSEHSPYYKWYRFKENKEYDAWWGIDTMPNVNEMDETYQNYIINDDDSVIKKWLKLGAIGWRLDVADELPDEFIVNLRKELKKINKENVLIGEVWEDASHKYAYNELRKYFLGEELDSVMNYPFRNAVLGFLLGSLNAYQVDQLLMSLYENYPKEVFFSCMNIIGTHDIPRILTILGEGTENTNLSKYEQHFFKLNEEQKKLAIQKLKIITLWQMTFPGVPSVYYGDEAGLEGHKDPLNRRTYPWGKENKELLEWYQNLIALRNKYEVLRTGQWFSLPISEKIYAFVRKTEKNTDEFDNVVGNNMAVVILNSGDSEQNIRLDLSRFCQGNMFLHDVLTGFEKIELVNGKIQINIKAYSGKLFLEKLSGRKSGILLHPTSLPGEYGIGDFGKEAYDFIDFLAESGQTVWQILPLNPVGYGESPYQCLSAFAGDKMLISVDKLVEDGLLKKENTLLLKEKAATLVPENVDFEKIKPLKEEILKLAFQNFAKQKKHSNDYAEFLKNNEYWLNDYAFFMALKEYHKNVSWVDWEDGLNSKDQKIIKKFQQKLKKEIEYHLFLQYIFFLQWKQLKNYANQKKIKVMGDLPIFIAHDSCDVWLNQHLFTLKSDGNPSVIAGVPPDYFSPTGQRWGNPLYRWEEMAKDDYFWWRKRIEFLLKQVDVIRIDHFRGFEAYWEIPAEEDTAVNGRWVKGPGLKFFKTMRKYLGELPIIVENLGFLTESVENLKNSLNFPGMKVLQFALTGDKYNPLNSFLYSLSDVLYTGTHDNETLLAWCERMDNEQPQLVEEISKKLFSRNKVSLREMSWGLVEFAFKTSSDLLILPLQDILLIGKEGRMNTPSVLGGNWSWRFKKEALSFKVTQNLKNITYKYGRNEIVNVTCPDH